MGNIWMFLQQTAAATLTALFLLLLQRIFLDKLSPRWQYGVWLVLLLRLLIPAGFGGRSTVLDVSLPLEALRTRVELGLSSAYSSPFASSLPAAPVPLPPQGAPESWTDWLFLLYWAGVAVFALWFVFCALRLSLRVRRGVPVEGARRAAIEALAKEYNLPLPRRVVECRFARTPLMKWDSSTTMKVRSSIKLSAREISCKFRDMLSMLKKFQLTGSAPAHPHTSCRTCSSNACGQNKTTLEIRPLRRDISSTAVRILPVPSSMKRAPTRLAINFSTAASW